MWGITPKSPVPNIPQVMVDFIMLLTSLVKDPSQLDPMVKAAQEITDANALTEQMAAELAAAEQTLKDAEDATARIAQKWVDLRAQENVIGQQIMKAQQMEQDNNDRNTFLSKEQALVANREAACKDREDAVAAREAAARAAEMASDQRTLELDGREQAVTKREKAIKAATESISAAG